MCTASMQNHLPNALTNLQGTSVTVPGDRGIASRQPQAQDVPLGEGLAAGAKNAILARRERIRKAVEGEQ